MTRHHLAQVINTLSTSWYDEPLDCDGWPEIAQRLLTLGGNWPAAVDLAVMSAYSEPAAAEALNRLAAQSRQDMNDLPSLDFWATLCGLVARSWPGATR